MHLRAFTNRRKNIGLLLSLSLSLPSLFHHLSTLPCSNTLDARHRRRRRRRRYHPPPKTEPDCPPETEPDCPPVLIVVRIGTRDTTSHCAPERPPYSDDGPTAITKRRYRRRLLRAEPPFDEQTLQPCALRGSPPVGEYFSKLFRKSNYVSFILDRRIVHVVFYL